MDGNSMFSNRMTDTNDPLVIERKS